MLVLVFRVPVDFLCEVVCLLGLEAVVFVPRDDLMVLTSWRRVSISLMASLRSAVRSEASLLNVLASSWSAFLVLFGVAGMTNPSRGGFA